MRTNQRRRGWRSRAGFSLVEVSLAIAICAVGLLALVGLLPTGMEASRRAADDSLVTTIGSDLLNWRRISPYNCMTYLPPGGASLTIVGPTTMYLDSMGNPQSFIEISGVVTTTVPNEYYGGHYFRVTENVMRNPMFPTSIDTCRVQITVQWPCHPSTGAPFTNNTQRTFVSNFTRMQ